MVPNNPKGNVKTLSSPDMIKTLTRTLTPPISPSHHPKPDTHPQVTGPRLLSEASRVSPPSSTTSNSSNYPISDPFIDANWPGRPKRNSFGEAEVTEKVPVTEKVLVTKVPKRQVSTPSPGTSSKPPIFPSSSPKVLGKFFKGSLLKN